MAITEITLETIRYTSGVLERNITRPEGGFWVSPLQLKVLDDAHHQSPQLVAAKLFQRCRKRRKDHSYLSTLQYANWLLQLLLVSCLGLRHLLQDGITAALNHLSNAAITHGKQTSSVPYRDVTEGTRDTKLLEIRHLFLDHLQAPSYVPGATFVAATSIPDSPAPTSKISVMSHSSLGKEGVS